MNPVPNTPTLDNMQTGGAQMPAAPAVQPPAAAGASPDGSVNTMEQGGVVGDMFKNIDWVGMTIIALAGSACFYMIWYYRMRIHTYKGEHVTLSNDVTELKSKFQRMSQASQKRRVAI